MERYLERLGSAEPTPGGGSAAAVVAAIAAALVGMVARITLGKARRAALHDVARFVCERADTLRAELLRARDDDEAAYRSVVDAMALPQSSENERRERMASLQTTLTAAAAAPLHVAQCSVAILALVERSFEFSAARIVSDLGCAAEFAGAGLVAAALNVRVNHRSMTDAEVVREQRERLEALEHDGRERLTSVHRRLQQQIR